MVTILLSGLYAAFFLCSTALATPQDIKTVDLRSCPTTKTALVFGVSTNDPWRPYVFQKRRTDIPPAPEGMAERLRRLRYLPAVADYVARFNPSHIVTLTHPGDRFVQAHAGYLLPGEIRPRKDAFVMDMHSRQTMPIQWHQIGILKALVLRGSHALAYRFTSNMFLFDGANLRVAAPAIEIASYPSLPLLPQSLDGLLPLNTSRETLKKLRNYILGHLDGPAEVSIDLARQYVVIQFHHMADYHAEFSNRLEVPHTLDLLRLRIHLRSGSVTRGGLQAFGNGPYRVFVTANPIAAESQARRQELKDLIAKITAVPGVQSIRLDDRFIFVMFSSPDELQHMATILQQRGFHADAYTMRPSLGHHALSSPYNIYAVRLRYGSYILQLRAFPQPPVEIFSPLR